jgi:hypothetical protein
MIGGIIRASSERSKHDRRAGSERTVKLIEAVMKYIHCERILTIPISISLLCLAVVSKWGFSPNFAETDDGDKSQER